MASDWSGGLPAHLFELIPCHFPIADFIKFGAVCKFWREVTADSPHNRITGEIPYLLLPGAGGDGNEDLGNLFSLSDQKVYHLPHVQIRGTRCLGSSDGVLVTIDDLAELHLLNPFTGASANLPSITTFSDIKGIERDPDDGRITGYIYEMYRCPPIFHDLEYMQEYYFTKVVFFPSVPAAVAIHGSLRNLAVARVGDESWTELKSPFSIFEDVIFHKGQFYAVSGVGLVLAFNVGDGNSSSPPVITFTGPITPFLQNHRHYLVESLDGDLLHVCRLSTTAPRDSDYFTRTTSFKIFRLDPSGLQRVEVRNLGGNSALFLGNNHSMSISTRDSSELKGNCIYFTEDNNENYVATPHARRDMGVFNLEDESVAPFFPCDSMLNRLNWPPPVWITPALSCI